MNSNSTQNQPKMKKSPSLTSLISVLFILCFSFALCASKYCNPPDLKALKKINAALGIFDPPGDCCSWDFVACARHPPHPVTVLYYFEIDGVSGQIPDAVGDLKSLTSLRFISLPNLTGNIPQAITKLPLLSVFTISETSLSGPIPTFLTNLTKLTALDLSANSLTGPIPPELTQLPKLNSLVLFRNKLTGTIPESFRHFKSADFKILFLSNNFLTGTVPEFLGNLNLETIDLSGNRFSGDPSFLFSKNKTNLKELYLDNNNFSFDLSNVTFAPNLKELHLSNNNIFGSLPEQLTQLSAIVQIDVSNNQLTGTISESFGHFKSVNFMVLSLANNFLTGTIPKSLGNTNLLAIDLSGNRFSGDPSFLFGQNRNNTFEMMLNNNNFSFDLSNVTVASSLFEFDLSSNNIFGSLPAQLTQLPLQMFNVSNNQLCGEIPQGGKLQTFGIDAYANNKCLCGPPLPACK